VPAPKKKPPRNKTPHIVAALFLAGFAVGAYLFVRTKQHLGAGNDPQE
jgi:hypothetical protein